MSKLHASFVRSPEIFMVHAPRCALMLVTQSLTRTQVAKAPGPVKAASARVQSANVPFGNAHGIAAKPCHAQCCRLASTSSSSSMIEGRPMANPCSIFSLWRPSIGPSNFRMAPSQRGDTRILSPDLHAPIRHSGHIMRAAKALSAFTVSRVYM
jgi:hypothetical protein